MKLLALLVAIILVGGEAPRGPRDDDGPISAAPVTLREIPQDFPLASGWPSDSAAEPGADFGLHGPNRRLAPISWERCNRRFETTGTTDRLRADWANVEDFRSRELLIFGDADAAVAFTADLVGWWRGCLHEDVGDGYERVNQVRRTAVGGESWALVSWNEYDGSPAVGLQVAHLTRLGRAVLVDTTSNEGGAGADRDTDIDLQVDDQVRATGEVVAAMCRFTEAGCGDS